MRLLSDISKLPKHYTYIITIGNFDGLHLGHRSLLWLMRRYARDRHWKTLLISFTTHTQKKEKVKLLYSPEQKRKKLANIGIDYQLTLDFENIKGMSYYDFLKWIDEHLRFGMLIASDKLKFGNERKGNMKLAKMAMEKINPETEVLAIRSKLTEAGLISSTLIREYLQQGELRQTAELLGEYYSIEGISTRGQQRGQKIGFPTLNIYPAKNRALPKPGVYFTRVTLQNHSFPALSFLGHPSFKSPASPIVIESHLLHFKKSGYNFKLQVEFLEFHRDNVKVDSLDDLKTLITNDKNKALSFFKSYTYLF